MNHIFYSPFATYLRQFSRLTKLAKYLTIVLLAIFALPTKMAAQDTRTRVIVTTDGEADDRCSMIRFLLTSNEFKIEGIVNSSSQFHWEGGKGWHAFHDPKWIKDYIDLYAQVYDNLILHDPNFPSPEHLLSKWAIGNISVIGEDRIKTPGAQLITDVLLDKTDNRPIWIQAWGGCNTIARALRTIQEEHPEKMEQVAQKIRLFLIWEQDETYQNYIRPNWEHLNIPTIISDQFDCMAYIWRKVLPEDVQVYFQSEWMQQNILTNHGPLCDAYEDRKGAFHAEGDTPAFLHTIPNGLQSITSPNYGGWGGRYVHIRNNVWMDPAPSSDFTRPTERWFIDNSWAKQLENVTTSDEKAIQRQYFRPIWRWLDDVQHDFAARADWCILDYASANHHPIVKLKNTPKIIEAQAGQTITLDASQSTDPDGDQLTYQWWHHLEASTYRTQLPTIANSIAHITVPADAKQSQGIHMICQVTDNGSPSLTRYQRVIIRIANNK